MSAIYRLLSPARHVGTAELGIPTVGSLAIVLSVLLCSSGGALAQQGANTESSSSNLTALYPVSPAGFFSVRDETRTMATAAPYVPPGGRECTSVVRACRDGMLLPTWQPIGNISALDKAGRAIVYMLALFYLFLGVSIIADRFMAAIEVITSTEREVTIVR